MGPATVKAMTIFAVAGTSMLTGCGDECSSYSDYSCGQIKRANYNVYFYYPSEQERYLGQAEGPNAKGWLTATP
jgi:hypothetical protein